MYMPVREITIKESNRTFSLFKKPGSKKNYDFSSLSSLRKLLSNEKARILFVIKSEKPSSLYELSKMLGRDFKGVYQDVKLLQRFGFVEIVKEKENNRIRHRPKIVSNLVVIKIKI